MWCQWALRSYRDLTNPFSFHFPLFQRRYMPTARTHSSPVIPMYAPTARRPRRIPNRYVPPTEHKIIKQAPIQKFTDKRHHLRIFGKQLHNPAGTKRKHRLQNNCNNHSDHRCFFRSTVTRIILFRTDMPSRHNCICLCKCRTYTIGKICDLHCVGTRCHIKPLRIHLIQETDHQRHGNVIDRGLTCRWKPDTDDLSHHCPVALSLRMLFCFHQNSTKQYNNHQIDDA